MHIYNICNDYSLELANKSEISAMREKSGNLYSKGKVNGLPCVYWRNKWAELIAVEVDSRELGGYVIGLT